MNRLEKRLAALEEIQTPSRIQVLFANNDEELKVAKADAALLIREGYSVVIVKFV